MSTYTLEPERHTLHGSFSCDLPPVLTIAPGDRVVYRTLDAGWGLEPPHLHGTPRRRFAPRDPERDAGHALCGPLAIQGAQPGMTLAVHIDEVRPGPYGWTWAGGPPHPARGRLGLAPQAPPPWAPHPPPVPGSPPDRPQG